MIPTNWKCAGPVLFILVAGFFLACPSAWGQISVDTTTFKDQSSASKTIATPAFSTLSGNELLLAFVSADYSSGSSTTVTGMSGAGLTWVLVIRTNVQSGTAEIWRAFAPAALSGAAVTATLSQSVAASLTVMSFTGVDTTGTNGSGAIGATGTGNNRSAAPTATLTTRRNGSLVLGVGNDWDNAIARSLGAGQSLIHQYLATVGDTYWVQRESATTPLSGTSVTINDTAPTTDRYNLSIVEVLASLNVSSTPDLTISKSHSGNFTQGQTGATYTITVTNSGSTATSGTVTATDTLPASLTPTAISGTNWSCALANLTCTRSDALAATTSYPAITLTVNVASNAPASVTNTATVSGGGESNTSNDTATDTTTINTPPDLTITKSHSGNFTQGQTGATYSITVKNSGGSATSGTVTMTDTLPSGLTPTAISGSGWTCTLATLTCARSDALAAGASYSAITLSVSVAGNAPASVTNTATVSGGGESNTSNDTATDTTTINTPPDLTITKSHSGNFTQGQTGATYTITAKNSGGSATSGTVTMTDTLPSGLTPTAISGSGWTCTLATLTCTRSDALAAATSYPAITLTVNVASNAPASVTNSATVSGGGETNTSNDMASDTTTINTPPDLTITKSHSGNFTQGQTGATYAITVTNSGGSATSGTVTMTDTLPSGLTPTAISGSGWTCTLSTLTCTRSDALGTGLSYPTITLTVSVASNAPSSVTNAATVSGGGETNTANGTATDVTTINASSAPPDLTISKSHSGNFTQGQTGATYAITVTNSGGSATSGTVTMTDTVPASLTPTAIAGTNWSCTLATLTCTRSDALAAGASYSAITLSVNVAGNAPSSVTNTATVSGGGESNTGNDTASDVTTITAAGGVITHVGGASGHPVVTNQTMTFSYTPVGTNNAVAVLIGCRSLGVAVSSMSLTAPGWNFTPISGLVGPSASYDFISTFGAITPNTATVTFTVTLTGGNGDCTSNDTTVLVDEFSGADIAGGTITFDAHNESLDSPGGSICTGAPVTPANSNDAIWYACFDNVTGVNAGYTKGQDDATGDWSEYKILSGGAGVAQNPGFVTNPSFVTFGLGGVSIKPATPAGIKLIQSNVNGSESGTANMSVSFASPNTQGNFLIISASAARPATTLTISDTLGNAYTPAIGPVTDTTQNVTIYIWYVPVCKGGANTVTITPSTTAALEIHVSEWTGLATVSPVDQTALATGTGTAVSSGSQTTTVNGELIFGYGWVFNTASAGAGFTPISLINGDLDEYQIQGAAGSTAATFTQISGTWFALMATFKPAGGVAPPSWTISGTITPSSGGANATVSLSGPANATTASDGSGNYAFAGLADGTYTVTPSNGGYSFSPSMQTVPVAGANVSNVNFTAQPLTSSALTIDAHVSKDQSSPSSTIATSAFSTVAPSELLLAFISTDYSSGTNTTVRSIAGGGLTWTLVARENVQSGTSEIWRAFSSSPLSNITVTSTLSQSVVSSMTVMSFSGADPSGTNGAGAIGATGVNAASSGAPSASLVTTRNGSMVLGVGNDWDKAIARSPSSGQTLVHQDLSATGDTYWVQMLSSAVPVSGTKVFISDTAPTTDRYNLAIAEVLPAPGSGGTSSPPVITMTSPEPNGTVSSKTTVAANASDQGATVTGVQFLLDGTNLGTQVTTSPYSILWDTTTSSAGAHTLSAIAYNSAGASTTSSPVRVTVDNSGNLAIVGSWSSVYTLPTVAVNLTLLKTNTVLFYEDGSSPTVWDYVNNVFTSVPASANLFCSGQTVLADGRILVVGGYGGGGSNLGIPNAEIFDPSNNSWTIIPKMAYARWYPTATTLSDGRVIVMGGWQTTDHTNAGIPEIYDPSTNTWTTLTNANNPFETYPFIYMLTDGRLVHVNGSEYPTVTDILNLTTQSWSTVDPNITDGGSAAMYVPNKIMKAGSATDSQGSGPSANTTFVLDMTQNSPAWKQTPSMAYPRSFLNLTSLPDGTVLATGGETDKNGGTIANAVYPAELWSPTTQTWATMAPMHTPREYHSTALLLPDARVLVSGMGADFGNVPDEMNAEFYSPPYLFKGTRPTITQAPAQITYAQNFFVQTPDGATISSAVLIRTGAVTHFFDQNARFVPVSFQQTSGGLTITAPATATAAPPGYYMLFIVNSNGVPSVAPFVQLQ